jgi:transposase-like protein
MTGLPATLHQAIQYFADPDNALNFAINMHWPDGEIRCPRCESAEHSFIATRRLWECKGCKKQFSVKVGTIFEDSPIGLDKWLCAMWLLANCKNGISSYEIARDISVTQKSAWFMLHRLRLAMQRGSIQKKLCGEVEADETFVGGKAKNMHLDELARRKMQGRMAAGGQVGKAIVMGLLERHGKARIKVLPTRPKDTLGPKLKSMLSKALTSTPIPSGHTKTWKATFMNSWITQKSTCAAKSTPTGWKTSGRCSSVR